MKFGIIRIIFIVLCLPVTSFSQTGSKSKRFLIEFNTLIGWGGSQIAGDANVPSVGTFGLGIGLGVNVKKFTLGLSYDYRILTQFSDVDATVGNRRGAIVSPTSLLLRINFEKIKFGLLLISNGAYELTNITSSGKKVVYTDPSGMRFDIIFKKMARFTPLLFLETISFSGMQLDGVKSALSSPLNYSNFGAGLKYDF